MQLLMAYLTERINLLKYEELNSSVDERTVLKIGIRAFLVMIYFFVSDKCRNIQMTWESKIFTN